MQQKSKREDSGHQNDLSIFLKQKATYFFEKNLDIERKGSVRKEDIEFYLLFHLTTVGRESETALLAELNSKTEAVWKFIGELNHAANHDDEVTLDQFLHFWQFLRDETLKQNELPACVHEWLRAGFDLYETDDCLDLDLLIGLYNRMGLNMHLALTSYRILSTVYGNDLNFEAILKIIEKIITCDDPTDPSAYLLPGFEVQKKDPVNQRDEGGMEQNEPKSNHKNKQESNQPSAVGKKPPHVRHVSVDLTGVVAGKNEYAEAGPKRTAPGRPTMRQNKPNLSSAQRGRRGHVPFMSERAPPTTSEPMKRLAMSGMDVDDQNYIMKVLKQMSIDPEECEFLVGQNAGSNVFRPLLQRKHASSIGTSGRQQGPRSLPRFDHRRRMSSSCWSQPPRPPPPHPQFTKPVVRAPNFQDPPRYPQLDRISNDVLRKIKPFVKEIVREEMQKYGRKENIDCKENREEKDKIWEGLSGQSAETNRLVLEKLLERRKVDENEHTLPPFMSTKIPFAAPLFMTMVPSPSSDKKQTDNQESVYVIVEDDDDDDDEED